MSTDKPSILKDKDLKKEPSKSTLVEFCAQDVDIENQSTVFEGFFKLIKYRFKHRLFAGGWSGSIERELFERGHASALLAYDLSCDSVVLVEQIRVGALESDAPWQLEVIAGMNDGLDPQEVVIKEAKEEAGLIVDNVQFICGFYSSSGGSSEKINLFLGLVDSSQAFGIHGLMAENEDIKVHVIPRVEAFKLIELGIIENACTIIALQWLEMNYMKLSIDKND